MTSGQFVNTIEARLLAIFRAYASGEDVPPALIYRTEGFIGAGCSMGLISEQEVQKIMQSLHQQVFKSKFPVMSGGGINIPSLMKRAPVYPSTK